MIVFEYLKSLWLAPGAEIDAIEAASLSLAADAYKKENEELLKQAKRASEQFTHVFDQLGNRLHQIKEVQESLKRLIVEQETMVQNELELLQGELEQIEQYRLGHAKRLAEVDERLCHTFLRIEELRKAIDTLQKETERRYQLLLSAERVLDLL